ncbi:multifunctional nucleotidyltransferase/glutamate rich protein GrpB/ribosomal protein alanine acetyltransferase [Legionella birminghamensis]|uniref:Aminoglycoside (3'') (9) adenylyltransferase n=1 Tax=Legionella birminghamensis TaxID=28083 RepID=A0A378IJ42_9GAMM|nr:nucleotidyltransferase domain-containing protein [Legionella birminghamensis]KTC76192.1 multifunctional nucleotidyltransferase/glutamate rich protein GrpB/ribosomal protein alanine acetyltransferase [Legionella birminghamensis]STX32184.1 Streptomycin 3''-adenylyltransferase [Legionella birminghamensis]
MNKPHTEFRVVNHLLTNLLSGLQSILKEHLVGVYVYGSFVWGDFDETTSDIDVLVALNQEMTSEEFAALDDFHSNLVRHFPDWNDRIEVAYASYRMLQRFKTEQSQIAVISPGEPFHLKKAGTDWLINYYLLQTNSLTLYGPSAKSIIAPVSNSEFIEHVKKQAYAWQDWVVHTRNCLAYQYYAVLTLCRALYVLQHQKQGSKLEAGTWAKNQFPKWRVLIQRALTKTELNHASDMLTGETYQEVTAFVGEMVQHIQEREDGSQPRTTAY